MNRDKYIEEKEFVEEGYSPVVDYDKWRVAILNYIDELEVENIDKFSKHNETDEVFVLLQGRCILYLKTESDEVFGIDMKPCKIYNIKKGIYHTHTLDEDAMVLIVENRDTSDENSTDISITQDESNELKRIKEEFWR